MSRFSTTLEIVKLRQKEAYYQGMINAVEEMSNLLNEHYFKDNSSAQNAVYEISENMYGFYISYVEEVQDEVLRLQQGEKTDEQVHH